MAEGGEIRGVLRQPPEQYPLKRAHIPQGSMRVWRGHYPGSQETWIPALSLDQIWPMALDKPLNFSTPQFSHLHLRALNEMMAHLPFISNSVTSGSWTWTLEKDRSVFRCLICKFTNLLWVSLSLNLLFCSRQIIRIHYSVLFGELNETMNVY